VGILVNRLRSEDWIARHPEILEERIESPHDTKPVCVQPLDPQLDDVIGHHAETDQALAAAVPA